MEEDSGRADDKAQVNEGATEQVRFSRRFMYEVSLGTHAPVNNIRCIDLRAFIERVLDLCPDRRGIEGQIVYTTDNVVLTYPVADRAHIIRHLQGNAMIIAELLRALEAADQPVDRNG